MVNEKESLQLPPAIRIAANSSRGRKEMTNVERTPLKNEAKATRLRQAQFGDSISSIDSLYIDTSQTTHSLEMLKKKLKKVEKILDKSAPGSKEHKKFLKKRIEYEKQIRAQDTIENIKGRRDLKSRSQQVEEREKILRDAPQRRSRLSWRRSLELKQKMEVVLKEVAESAEGELEAEEVMLEGFKRSGIETKDSLQKKRGQHKAQPRFSENCTVEKRNVENDCKSKLLHLHINEEKGTDKKIKKQEHLEEARTLKYEALEKNVENTAEKRAEDIGLKVSKLNVYGHYDKDKKAKKEAHIEEARRLKHEAFEKKIEEEKLSKKTSIHMREVEKLESELSHSNNHTHLGEEEKVKKQTYIDEARRLIQEVFEKKREEEKSSKKSSTDKQKVEELGLELSQSNNQTHLDEEENLKEAAYLGEVRKLKQETLESKRKKGKVQKNAEEEFDEMVESGNPSQPGLSATREIQNKDSEKTNASKYAFVQKDNRRGKQAFLEEALRSKQEALEKKSKEEELMKKIEVKKDEEVKENRKKTDYVGMPVAEGIQSRIENDDFNYLFMNNNEKRRKQAYLEEARKLKKEAMEKKIKESHIKKEQHLEKEKFQEVKSSGDEYSQKRENIKMADETSQLDYIDDQENESDTEEQKQDEPRTDSALISESILQDKELNYVEEIKLKGELQREQNDSTTSKKSISLDDNKSKADFHNEEEQRNDDIISCDSTYTKNLDSFEESKPKVGDDTEDEYQDDSNSVVHPKIPKLLEEIISKANDGKEVEQQHDFTSSADSCAHTEIPIFPEETETKAEGRKENEQQYDPDLPTSQIIPTKNSELLKELGSKAELKSECEELNNFPSSIDSARPIKMPNFLEEIISKGEKRNGGGYQNDSRASTDSPINSKKPKFLEGIKLKVEEQNGDEQQNDSSTISSTLSIQKNDRQRNISTPLTHPAKTSKPSFLLEDIRSKAKEKEKNKDQLKWDSTLSTTRAKSQHFLEDVVVKIEQQNENEDHNNSISSADSTRHARKPNYLKEIEAKSKKPAPEPRKPNFLEEIKSKACFQKEGTHQNEASQSSDYTMHNKKTDLQEAIKSKGGIHHGDEQENDSTSYSDSISHAKNSNFLEEIASKVRKKEVKVNDNKDSSASVTTNVRESEQNDRKETEKVYFPTKKETSASPASQKQEASEGYLDRRKLLEPLSNNTKKILRELENNEIRQKKLEKSLMQNGIRVTEDIPYEVAKDKITEITESMKTLASVGMDSNTMEKEYFRLEEQLSKYTTALMLTDEYAEEHRRMEQDWEESIVTENIVAIRKLRSHMPVNIRHLTEDELITTTTPNGKLLPKSIARKFKRTNILQLLRVDPNDIRMMHPSLLEGMRTTGLTLTERRALHEHFRGVVERWTEKRSDPSIEKKYQWYQMLKSKFKETLAAYLRCVEQYGSPGSHQYAKRDDPKGGGCPLLGKQCPIKADSAIDYGDDYGYTKEATYEKSGNRSDSKKESIKCTSLTKLNSTKGRKSSEQEIFQEYRDRLRFDTIETDVEKKLLRELVHSDKRTKTLEMQLTQAGLSLPKEDISYDEAKSRVAELTKELNALAMNMGNTNDGKLLSKLEHSFGQLSQELDKYTNALMLTKEWAQEQKDKEREWETGISAANYEALQKVRRHMPVNIRNMSETSLTTGLTPNGKVLPKAIAKKFKRTNILMILRTDPSVIEAMHPSSLESMRTTGLTLTERRALHEHLKDVAPKWKAMASDKMCERKWMWHASLQSKFKEMLEKYSKQNQCSIRADLVIDYSGDYGYPDNAEYEQQIVAKSNLLSMEELEKRKL